MNSILIDEIPKSAEYYPRGEFFRSFCPGREDEFLSTFQILDTRVTKKDLIRWQSAEVPSYLSNFFEIKDFQESAKTIDILCSLCLFKMEVEQLHTSKEFQIYIDGLRYWIDKFRNDRRNQKLRIYVGDSAWEILHTEGLLRSDDVDFVRMAKSSTKTEYGTFWRFLAFDDYDYDYVYVEDTDKPQFKPPHMNDEIIKHHLYDNRFDMWTRLNLMIPDESRSQLFPDDDFPLLFWSDDIRLSDPLFMFRLSEYLQNMTPMTLRGPKRLPFKMKTALCSHFLRGAEDRILYFPAINAFTNIRERHPNLNFRFIDELWLFHLTRVIRTNFVVNPDHLLLMKPYFKSGDRFFVKRLYDRLVEDGNRIGCVDYDDC